MRVLIVSPRQCWPARSGAKLRDYHLAQALGTRGDLTYLYYADPGAAPMTDEHLPFARPILLVPRPRAYTPGKLLRGLAGTWPLSVVNYHSLAMERALLDVLREPFDLVQFDATHLAAFAPLVRSVCPGARIVFDWHNVESELLRRYADSHGSPLRRFYASVTARKMEALEADLLGSDAWHLVCSEREKLQLQGISPGSRIAVIGNGVDADYYRAEPPATSPSAKRKRLLFVGLMSYHANIEAALWFTRDVWPAIRAQFPQLTLTLAGADPVPAVLELTNVPGVEVTGTVPDLRPLYREAFAAVVPLRTGAGTRLKILEAMAAGAPVISTPLGAEGLAVSPGKDILFAGDTRDWLDHLSGLAVEENRKSLTTAAHALIDATYDWRIIGHALLEQYSRWFEDLHDPTISPQSPELQHPLRPSRP